MSEDIERYFQMLYLLNIQATDIFHERTLIISENEKKRIQELTLRRDELNDTLMDKGRSYANQYDAYYRKLIEDFLRKIEIEMTIHLDRLQQDLQNDREVILNRAAKNVQSISEKADQARKEFYFRLQQIVIRYRQEIMRSIDDHVKNSSNLPLGFEQLRKITFDIYATVGDKGTQICQNIDAKERDEYVKELARAKSHQPQMKRTVFLDKDIAKS